MILASTYIVGVMSIGQKGEVLPYVRHGEWLTLNSAAAPALENARRRAAVYGRAKTAQALCKDKRILASVYIVAA